MHFLFKFLKPECVMIRSWHPQDELDAAAASRGGLAADLLENPRLNLWQTTFRCLICQAVFGLSALALSQTFSCAWEGRCFCHRSTSEGGGFRVMAGAQHVSPIVVFFKWLGSCHYLLLLRAKEFRAEGTSTTSLRLWMWCLVSPFI